MKLFLKIIGGLLALIVVLAISAWLYFSAGEESYPEGLAVGTSAPHFSGNDQFGNSINLSELTNQGSVVLIFFRGSWCPTCNQHIAMLQDSLQLIKQLGAEVVLVTPEKTEYVAENDIKRDIDIPVIYDSDLSIMNSYNVTYELSAGSRRIFSVAGVDFNEINADGAKLPIPATFIIDGDGKIKDARIGEAGLQIEYPTVKELLDLISD